MKHVRQISNLVARVAKIMNLRWLKDNYITCRLQQRLLNQMTEKISKRHSVFPARG